MFSRFIADFSYLKDVDVLSCKNVPKFFINLVTPNLSFNKESTIIPSYYCSIPFSLLSVNKCYIKSSYDYSLYILIKLLQSLQYMSSDIVHIKSSLLAFPFLVTLDL